MKNFEDFLSQLRDKTNIEEDQAIPFLAALINNLEEGKKKKKKRPEGEDEEGKAPKTGHEMIDPDLGFEDPLKGYPEEKRIY